MDFRHIFAYPLFMFQGPSTRKTFVWLARNAAGMSRPAWPSSRSNPSLWSARCAAKGAAICRQRCSLDGPINWWRVRSGPGGADVRSRRQHAPHQPGKGAPDIRNWRQIDDGYRARQSCTLILKLREGKDKFPRQAIFAITHGT